MKEEQLINYITGNIDKDEAAAVRKWIVDSEENRKEFYRLKNIYALSRGAENSPEINSDYLIVKKKLTRVHEGTLIRMLRQSLKYAAVAAITLLAVYFTNKLQDKEPAEVQAVLFHQVTVPMGQISEFEFADGTRAWLNAGTTLRIPETGSGNQREVYLEGEAYFDVTKNEEKPFVVYSGLQEVRVFGTAFNIRAYSEMDHIETTLVEGSLGVRHTQMDGMVTLKPGEQFRLSLSGGKNILQKIDTQPLEAWKDGKLIFRNRPLCDIANDLERWYNVKIRFEDEEIKQYRFSGTILKYKPIDQILEAIKLTSPIRFSINVHPERSSEIVLYAIK
jgi:transmembrane sensor